MEQADWTTRAHFKDIPAARPGARGNPHPMSHCKQYSQHEFIELLDYSGFRVVELQRVGGGGHQMLAIAQIRVKERGTALTRNAPGRKEQLKRAYRTHGWRGLAMMVLGGKLPRERS